MIVLVLFPSPKTWKCCLVYILHGNMPSFIYNDVLSVPFTLNINCGSYWSVPIYKILTWITMSPKTNQHFIKSIFYKSIIPLFIMKFYLDIHYVNFLYQIWPILHYYNFNYNTINHRVVNNKKTSPQVHVLGYYFSLIYNQTNINLSCPSFLWTTQFFLKHT